MPKWLLKIVIISGILTLIASIPGAIYLGLILFGVPGFLLVAAPNIFVISSVAYVGGSFLRRFGPLISWAIPLSALAAVSVALPMYWNAPQLAEIDRLSAADKDWSGFAQPIETIALLTTFELSLFSKTPSECHELCQRLLFNGTVRAVLAGSAYRTESLMRGDERITRYSVEKRDNCPPIKVPNAGLWTDERLTTRLGLGPVVSDRVKARIAAGECLIAEPADLISAEAIVEDRQIRTSDDRFRYTNLQSITADTISARRLRVLVRSNSGTFEETFRQTSVTA